MDTSRTAQPQPAVIAKGALRRLAAARQEPTPDNYARAYAEESGQPLPASAHAHALASDEQFKSQGTTWALLFERLVRQLERGGRQWTAARRKESLRRVLDSSRSDPQRLLQRLQSLMGAWESDQPSDVAQTGVDDPPSEAIAAAGDWPLLVTHLQSTVRGGLSGGQACAAELADELADWLQRLNAEGLDATRVGELDSLCQRARRWFGQRHRLLDQLTTLCRELTAAMPELAEDDSWARGQCEALRERLGDELDARSVRAATSLLAQTLAQQRGLRSERQAAREALKQMIRDMLVEVGELGGHTGRFQTAAARHAEAIAQADNIDGLADVVRAMLEDARAVNLAVQRSQERLLADQSRAEALQSKVQELETELRRLAEEVSTDALTQVANRRGLMQAFEIEAARATRDAAAGLAVGLIDIDNFKRLNDNLGHAAGDRALQLLAAAVRERLRPVDHLARFGGEEFVVLLPGTAVDEARQALTRLQRSLSESLFLHEGREVFITFSAGVTCWRSGETLQATLDRADEAMYEAKRSGKNRTCIA